MRGLILLCLFVMGCASGPKSPQELKISHAIIVPGENETNVEITGLPGKGPAVGVGIATGAGAGFGTAALLCAGTGPIYPFCLASYGTVVLAAGTFGGAVVAAATAEDFHIVEAKRNMLTQALIDLDANQSLAPLVYIKSLESSAVKPSREIETVNSTEPEWTLRILLDEFATVGSGPEKPYSLQLSASLEVIHLGDKEPAIVKSYQANSPLRMSTAEWRANQNQPVRSALNDLLTTLSKEISDDLKPIQLSLNSPLKKYKVSVKSITTPVMEASTPKEPDVILKSEPDQRLSPFEKEANNSEQPSLFDSSTGLNWVVVDSSPVDLQTANIICRSLKNEVAGRYRIPSLNEFEQLWGKYKSDDEIELFKGKEYSTSDEDDLTRSGYTKTFSFFDGTSGNTYAADLACVSK